MRRVALAMVMLMLAACATDVVVASSDADDVDDEENWGSVGLSQGQALESQCGGVSFAGECDGNVVAYCREGELVTVDCGAHGLTCGWNGDEGYNDCR